MNTRFFKQILTLIFFLSARVYPQVFMEADGITDPYSIISSKGYGIEETSLHPGFKHVTQTGDTNLKKFVFNFIMHRDIDGDGAERIDRQRLEMKTWGPSPSNMKASKGETHNYRWKFKLDSGFQPTTNFCHIHQLKAGDGSDASSPIITLTPRKSSPDKMQIIFVAPTEKGGATTYLKEVPLDPFKGEWVEVIEKVKFDMGGTYSVEIRKVSDGQLLLIYSNDNIDIWRNGTTPTTFVRPKFGIYRSLGSNLSQLPNLCDETVLFADFYLAEGTNTLLPSTPDNLTAAMQSARQINLSWSSAPISAGLFRIDRSINGSDWNYLATAKGASQNFSDTSVSASEKYYYRVRGENSFGNSGYSNIADATTSATDISADVDIPANFGLANYPNPFNPRTMIQYKIPAFSHVQLKIFDSLGREIMTLVDEERQPGIYSVKFNANFSVVNRQMSGGVYYARITAGRYIKTIKLLLLK